MDTAERQYVSDYDLSSFGPCTLYGIRDACAEARGAHWNAVNDDSDDTPARRKDCLSEWCRGRGLSRTFRYSVLVANGEDVRKIIDALVSSADV